MAEPSDTCSVCTAIKVQIPTAHVGMCLMLQGFNALLTMILKPGHHLVTKLSHFNLKFMNKEPFFMSHLQGVDPKYGPVRMPRCIQLCIWAFFVDMINADISAAAVAVSVLQFQACLCDMMVGDMLWLPMLPQHHCSIMPPLFHHAPKVLDVFTLPIFIIVSDEADTVVSIVHLMCFLRSDC